MFQPPLPPEPPPPLPNGQQIPVPQAGGTMQQPWGGQQPHWHPQHPPPQQPWGHQQQPPPWGPGPHPMMMMQQHQQQQQWQHQQWEQQQWHHQQLLQQQHQQRQQWHQQQQQHMMQHGHQQQQQQWMQHPHPQHFPGPGPMQQPALPPQQPGWPAHAQPPPAVTGPQQPQQPPPSLGRGPDASPPPPLPPPAEAPASAAAGQVPEQQQPPPDTPPLGPRPPLDLRSLLLPPGRASRPRRLLLLLRGLPGSGKSHLARLVRQVELSQGAPAPRCHSLDDYFMVEAEQEAPAEEQQQQQPGSRRPGTPGAKRRLQLVQQYVHDAAMEGRYWRSLLKALGRSLGEGGHGLVLLDAPLLSGDAVKEAWSAGQQAGYDVVVVAPLATDPQVCFQQNIHGRSLGEVAALAQQYEPPPATYTTATATALLGPAAGAGSSAIDDVDMTIEDLSAAPSPPPAAGRSAADPSAAAAAAAPRSRWEDDDDGRDSSDDAADAAAAAAGGGGGRSTARPAKKARLLLHVDVGDGGADDAIDAIDHQALLAGVNLELEQLDAAEEAAAAAAGGGGRSGGLASAGSGMSLGGGSLTSGGGSKSILKGPTTPVSAKKKVRWPDEQQPAPGAAQEQQHCGLRRQGSAQAARPLAEVYWLDGLGRDGAGWRDDSPNDEEAFEELSANVGAASAAAAAALSGSGSRGLARHSFAQQVQAEHRSEHNMFRAILLGPSAAPTCQPAVGPANKPRM